MPTGQFDALTAHAARHDTVESRLDALEAAGGGGDSFVSQMKRWGAVVVAASSLRGMGCFEQMATGANAWLGASGTNARTSHLLYTLSWSRASTNAAINSQISHFSGTIGDAEFASRFARKNSVSANYEGFKGKVRFAITGPDFGSPSVVKTDYRLIAGFLGTTNPSATASPSALTNCIFIGKDHTDSNLQLMHNDASGTCTKADLGSSLGAAAIDRIPFEFRVTAVRGGTSMSWSLIRLDTFAVAASGTVTTDLIATDARVFPGLVVNTGPSTSTAVDGYCGGTYMEADFVVPE